ncbi:hypothetical protein MKX01_040763 [Papaver californicum]|nr:hypothetical protein MKX01_040763 [Papaver californicum]
MASRQAKEEKAEHLASEAAAELRDANRDRRYEEEPKARYAEEPQQQQQQRPGVIGSVLKAVQGTFDHAKEAVTGSKTAAYDYGTTADQTTTLGQGTEYYESGVPMGSGYGEDYTATAAQKIKEMKDTAADRTKEFAGNAAEKARQAKDSTVDTTKQYTGSAADKARQTREAAERKTREYADTNKDYAGSAAEKARQAKDATVDTTGDYAGRAADQTKEYAGAAADKARQAKDATVDTTYGYASRAADQTKEYAGAAAEKARQAKDATVDTTKSYAGSSADKTKEYAGYAADKARQAKDSTVDTTKEYAGYAADKARQAKDATVDTTKEYAGYAADRARQAKDVTIDTTKDYAGSATEKARQAKDATIDTTKDYAGNAAEKARQAKDAIVDTTMDYAGSAADKAREAKDYTADKAVEGKDTAVGKIVDLKDSAADAARRAMDFLTGKKDETKDKTYETAEAAKDKTNETAQAAKDKTYETAQSPREKAAQTGQATKDKMGETEEATRQKMEDMKLRGEEYKEGAKQRGGSAHAYGHDDQGLRHVDEGERGTAAHSNIFGAIGSVTEAIKEKFTAPKDVGERARLQTDDTKSTSAGTGPEKIIVDVHRETPAGQVASKLKACDQMTGQTFNDVGNLEDETTTRSTTVRLKRDSQGKIVKRFRKYTDENWTLGESIDNEWNDDGDNNDDSAELSSNSSDGGDFTSQEVSCDPSLWMTNSAPALLVREHAILFNLGSLHVIAMQERVLIFDYNRKGAKAFLEHLMPRLAPKDVNGAPSMPFELEVVEAMVSRIQHYERKLMDVEPRVVKLLEVLPNRLTADVLEQLRLSNQTLVELGSRAGALKQMLLDLLEDPDEICRMCIMGRDCTIRKGSTDMDCAFDVDKQIAEEEEEIEMLLENYLQRCESCHAQAESLLDLAKEMEDSIAVNLSSRRLEVSRMELLLQVGTFFVAIGALVAGIFGMNLKSYLEEHVFAFWWPTGGIILGAFAGFFLMYTYLKARKMLY